MAFRVIYVPEAMGHLRVFYDVEHRPDVVVVLAVGTKVGDRLLIGGVEVRL